MLRPVLFGILSSGALLVSAALSQDAEYKGLTARELCLRPPAPAVPKTASKPKAKPAVKPASGQVAVPDPGEIASLPRPDATVKLVSATVEPSVPLGMRYSLLKRIDGRFEEVSPGTVFRAGDRMQLHVETFDSGYLYIVHQGSSKRWEVLFPNADTDAGDNRVARNRVSKLQFYFDEQPGNERLFIVFTRQPQTDLENLIYSVSTGGQKLPAAAPVPAVKTPAAPSIETRRPKILMAAHRPPALEDDFVTRLRSSLMSRDLVFEKVDEESGEKKDKAVYVAIPSRSPDARLVADLDLKHQ